MKTVSVVIPTYNEEKNIPLICERVKKLFQGSLSDYSYEILFIDNGSKDESRAEIKKLAEKDVGVKYIFNIKNFGFSRSVFHGLINSNGDCSVLLFADMQDPPELICDFVSQWEKGYKVVAGIKNSSKENKCMYFVRSMYYKFINRITSINHIEHFTGFGLYDRTVIETFRKLDDPLPYLRGIVAELAPECTKVFYTQEIRKFGKSSFKFNDLYDTAMLGITSYSKSLLRFSTFFGAIVSVISFIISLITIILKMLNIVSYPIGNAAILFGVFFLGGIQLIMLGIIGEYIANINIRSMRRPLVVEEERNF